ncbi:MAG TPA: sigma-70 family RNA polymerase sigma factor [Pirellulaceae bacterium]|nr:sigma-70 family RNA polymerase sigma factor [Pirellulaceae bacterium]
MSKEATHSRVPEAPSTRVTLLARLREAGDEQAWETFVDLYLPLVYRYCRSRGLQDADACDVTQQVLVSVHGAISSFDYDPQRGRFRDWLGTIAYRAVLRQQQKDRRPGKGQGAGESDLLAGQAGGPVDAAWLEEFNVHIFSAAVERIRPEFDESTWQAFDWTWLHDVKTQEAAQRLGTTSAWVYKARFRVLQRLRSEIEFLTNDVAALHRPG